MIMKIKEGHKVYLHKISQGNLALMLEYKCNDTF